MSEGSTRKYECGRFLTASSFASLISVQRIATDTLITETITLLRKLISHINERWDEIDINEDYRIVWINILRELIRRTIEELIENEWNTMESLRVEINEYIVEINSLRKFMNLPLVNFYDCSRNSIHILYELQQEIARLKLLKRKYEENREKKRFIDIIATTQEKSKISSKKKNKIWIPFKDFSLKSSVNCINDAQLTNFNYPSMMIVDQSMAIMRKQPQN